MLSHVLKAICTVRFCVKFVSSHSILIPAFDIKSDIKTASARICHRDYDRSRVLLVLNYHLPSLLSSRGFNVSNTFYGNRPRRCDPAGPVCYEILIFPSKLSKDSFFLLSVASAYTFIVVPISAWPMISCITLMLVSFSQNRVQNVCRRL